MKTNIFYLFTRTPLHVGAGNSVGAIDQPIIRERHTGFPIIPGSSLKGVIADLWNGELIDKDYKRVKPEPKKDERRDKKDEDELRWVTEAAWLFGSDDAHEGKAAAGSVLISEAMLLAFPVRSAKGCFAWITSPLLIQRAVRAGVLKLDAKTTPSPKANEAMIFGETLKLDDKVVLEEYCFDVKPAADKAIADAFKALVPTDPIWETITERLVILNDELMSFFSQNACEVAQHVKIDDETGTAAGTGLFNQENVPADTLFYSQVTYVDSQLKAKKLADCYAKKTAEDAATALAGKLKDSVLQIGGDASTGLGYCSVRLA